MFALSAEEARALTARLAGSESSRSAGETLAVSANASTSVTFTEAEKVAVLDVLVANGSGRRAITTTGPG
jgi:hypothetical protein